MVINLSSGNSLIHVYLRELRDIHIQSDRARFRKNLERIGQILAYEISKTLQYEEIEVETPLTKTTVSVPAEHPVLCGILRAGIPLFNGFVSFYDHSDCSFVGAYRGKHALDHSFEIELDYAVAPRLDGRSLILIDPMLATGKSIIKAYEALKRFGQPKKLHIASVISSPEGIEWLQSKLPEACIWTAAIDRELDADAYIIPGLGDAGDLSYGTKES
jgi:uracil phosphoribosyltransferase